MGLMVGVTDKESYGRVRIAQPLKRIQWLQREGVLTEPLAEVANECECWLSTRQRNWNGKVGGKHCENTATSVLVLHWLSWYWHIYQRGSITSPFALQRKIEF